MWSTMYNQQNLKHGIKMSGEEVMSEIQFVVTKFLSATISWHLN